MRRRIGPGRRAVTTALGAGLAAALAAGGCGGDDGSGAAAAPPTIPQPTHAQLAAAGLDKLPLAPESERVDMAAPTFSDPTEITNPLFPISDLHSAVLSGRAWLAGRDGPPEMIMPADPQVSDVHRAENIPAVAFEEVAVKTVGKTVNGPAGPVDGAMVARELHDDGAFSDKVFAPGYGEFFTRDGADVEAMALAVPTDALDGPLPPELEELSGGANDLYDSIRSGEWKSAAGSEEAVTRAWAAYQRGEVPPRIAAEMDLALRALPAAIDARDPAQAGTAAIDVARSALDLELRYRPPSEVDIARFELWARQLLVDAAAGEVGGVRADVSAMEWTRDRFGHTLEAADLTRLDTELVELRDTVSNGNEDFAAARAEAARLRGFLAGLEPVS